MERKEIRLKESQIRKMKHAVGFGNMGTYIRNGRYECYRNRYCSPADEDWEDLVAQGLAGRNEDPFCKGSFFYYVTKEGLECLGRILGVVFHE